MSFAIKKYCLISTNSLECYCVRLDDLIRYKWTLYSPSITAVLTAKLGVLLCRLRKVKRSETARRFLKRSSVESASLERHILISRLLVKRIIAFSRWSEVKPKTSDIQQKMEEIRHTIRTIRPRDDSYFLILDNPEVGISIEQNDDYSWR